MKPKILKMTAFGSYKNETVIDFTQLGNEVIYLICGDTGAGKTTIFDAICFALYGEPSGKERQKYMLHSKYALSETPTKVVLTFSCKGKEYTVTRCFTEGKTPTKKDFTLEIEGSDPVVGKSEVDRKIVELLGLTRDQFSQIVMIAQGDFLKVLTAKTEDRQKIFRKLFKTDVYNDFQDRIKTDTAAAKATLDRKYEALDACINNIDFPENHEKYGDFLELKQSGNTSELTRLASLLIAEDKTAEQSVSEEIITLEEQQTAVSKALGKAEKIEESKRQLEQLLSVRTEKSQRLSLLGEEKAKQEQNLPVIEGLKKQITTAENELPKYEQRNNLLGEIKKLDTVISQIGGRISLGQNSADKLRAETEQLETEMKSYSDDESKAAEKQVLVEKLRSDFKEFSALKNQIADITAFRQEANSALEIMNKADTVYRASYQNWLELNRQYISAQAFHLAKGLKAGVPCPVCGSKEHPRPALNCENTVSWEQVSSAQNAYNNAQADYNRASADYSAKQGKLENAQNALFKNSSELGIEPNAEAIEAKLAEITSEGTVARAELDRLKANIDRRNRLSELIPANRNRLEAMNNQISGDKENLASTRATLAQMQQRYDSIKLPFPTLAEMERNINGLKQNAIALENQMNKARNDFNECEKELASLSGKIEELEKSVKSAESEGHTDIRLLNQKFAEISESLSNKRNLLTCVKQRGMANSKALSALEKAVSEKDSASKKYTMLQEMCNVVIGKEGENGKLRLEAYIQTMYLDRITKRANVYLKGMTNGQFALKRSEEVTDKRSQFGLDLSVSDAMAGGKLRSVSSLSGGESFMASLSLALGLSEEIQSSSGGIEISAMFVDEGFGNLDGNALELSIKALQGLSGNNRQVGIISHVEELEEMIGKKIIVTKNSDGSSARIVLN